MTYRNINDVRYVSVRCRNGKDIVMFTPELIAQYLIDSPLLPELLDIAALPSLGATLYVYPDASMKTFGWPSGLLATTVGSGGYIYPAAMPDASDAFLVAALDAHIDSIDSRTARQIFYDLEETLRTPRVLPGEHKFGLRRARSSTKQKQIELGNLSWLPEKVQRQVLASYGVAYGHFVELRIVRSIVNSDPNLRRTLTEGQIVAIVHMGAGPIADYITFEVGEKMVERNIAKEDIPRDMIRKGYYGAPRTSDLGREYLYGYERGASYAFRNRLLILDKIATVVGRFTEWREKHPAILSHKVHSGIERGRDHGIPIMRSFRGVQAFSNTEDATAREYGWYLFVAGGLLSPSYLVSEGEYGSLFLNRCSHGIPAWEMLSRGEDGSSDTEGMGNGEVLTNAVIEPGQRQRDCRNGDLVMQYLANSLAVNVVASLSPFMSFHFNGVRTEPANRQHESENT
ncbi:RtcB family protein [Acidiferrobacter sp. SPIII_3]|uniref:RtcB family protein n=1 Tax=Acidiferrobacter sp. SPIII_3 TaxID=1281578 RepID=UPI0011AB8600|nr:RtcB family protein [Acidiferrobacter sp. SPIII_3]